MRLRARAASGVAVFAGFLFAGGLCAAQAEDPHAACATPPAYVPAEILSRPLPLRQGIGNSHETITTSNAQAQAYYDQGLNYLESYVWIEAARSFNQALHLDPKLAMAYVGLSRVYSGLDDPAAAALYLEKAKSHAEGISDGERGRIEIRAKQLDAIADLENGNKFLAYKKAIDDALAADMDDPQLWLLRGNAEESNASGRGQRGTAGSIVFYEKVLQIVPDHASAHHYLIHSYETIGRADKALEHGEAYARLAPAIPHAAHMWGHDLRRVGRVDDAIVQFKKAYALEADYYRQEKLDPALDWHHGHNLDLLATCYQYKGQIRQTEKTMREATSLKSLDAYRAFNMRELPGFLIQRGRYQEALGAAKEMGGTEFPQSRCVGHALAGEALIGLRKMDDATHELEAAEEELKQVPLVTPGTIPRRSAVEPWVEALRGEIQLRTGKEKEGRETLRQVERAMRAIPGPDAWTQTLFRLELIAATAREVGDWELADFTAAQMLDHDPAYAGSHLARALVLEHRGDPAGAAKEFDAARLAWRDADPDLPELKLIPATQEIKASR